jgi:N utilization substance protein B
MKRTVLREHVFRIIFRFDFHDKNDFTEQINLYFDEYPDLSDYPEIKDYPDISEMDRAEIISKINDFVSHLDEIDDKISTYCKGWTIDRIAKAELAIIRLACYEMLFDEDVDKAVAINEAVELSKKYASDKSPSFVNGVLSKIQ